MFKAIARHRSVPDPSGLELARTTTKRQPRQRYSGEISMRLPILAAAALTILATPADADDGTGAYLNRIARLDRTGPALGAVITTTPDRVVSAPFHDGPLAGRAVLVKDNIETAEFPTTAGSLALAGNRTGRDAPLIARLRARGIVILGKTNLSEWANIRSAMSTSGWSAVGGQTRNPYA